MGKLVVFLQTNKMTGACCNPGRTPEEAANLCYKSPPIEFPICIKREAFGSVGVTLDCFNLHQVSEKSLISLLTALEGIDR